MGRKILRVDELARAGFPILEGFVISSKAYFQFLSENSLKSKILHLLTTTYFERPETLTQISSHIKKHIMKGKFSDEFVIEIDDETRSLGGILNQTTFILSPSLTGEHGKTLTLANHPSPSSVAKGVNLFISVKEVWARLFEPKILFHSYQHGLDFFHSGIDIIVQKSVSIEKSGKMFTIDPVAGDKTKIIIKSVSGYSEWDNKKGEIYDYYVISKKTSTIIDREIAKRDAVSGRKNTNENLQSLHTIPLSSKISSREIVSLAELARKIEKHFYFPQEVHWVVSNGKIFITKIQPITPIFANTSKDKKTLFEKHFPIMKGLSLSPFIASGFTRVIYNPQDIKNVKPGEILVLTHISPFYLPAIKKARAVIVETGEKNTYASTLAQTLGFAAIVGVKNATKILKSGIAVTVHGEKGHVYKGGFL